MIKKTSLKKVEPNLTTCERLTKDPKRRAKIKKDYKQLLLSELLIAIMEEDHVSVRKLAKAAKISPSIIQDIRSGKKENITLKSFSNIATALGYTVVLEKSTTLAHK
jgi:transcriptional regulator with XRE-family HTH domain